MNRKLLAERVRGISAELGEAVEERLLSNRQIAEQLRGSAYDTHMFFECLECANLVEGIDESCIN